MEERAWLGRVPAMRWERHFDRVVRCFVDRPGNAYDLLAEAAARNGDGEAIVCGAERLSYRELEDAVARCAAGLAAAGIGPGDRVAMLLGNGIAFPVIMFAALRLGAIAVPLSVREQTQGLAYMLGPLRREAAGARRRPGRPPARGPTPTLATRRGRSGRALDCAAAAGASEPAPRRLPCTRRIRRSSSTPRAPPGGRKARC